MVTSTKTCRYVTLLEDALTTSLVYCFFGCEFTEKCTGSNRTGLFILPSVMDIVSITENYDICNFFQIVLDTTAWLEAL